MNEHLLYICFFWIKIGHYWISIGIIKLFKEIFINQLKNIIYCIHFAFYISFIDKKQNTSPPPAYSVPGLILGLPLGLLTLLLVTGFRILYENLSSLCIFFLRGFQAAQQRLGLKSFSFNFDIEFSSYQKLLGFLASMAYLPGYLGGMSYGIIIQLFLSYTLNNCIDCISFFWNLSLFDLRRFENENSNSVIGIKNLYGILGYLLGVFIGLPLGLITVFIRLVVEFIPGLKLGLDNQNIVQSTTSKFQDALRLPGYVLGLIIYSNLKVFLHCHVQVLNLLFKDSFAKQSREYKLNLWQSMLGGFAGALALPSAGLGFILGVLIRLGMDSSLSFRDSFALMLGKTQNDMTVPSLQTTIFAAPGKLLGVISGGLIYVMSLPLIAVYKWQQMLRFPRFQLQEQDAQVEVIKSLYGLLNSYQRQFPQSPPKILAKNPGGGKGSYCFISKVIHLNQPTASEIYLDEVLAQKRKKPVLEAEDCNQIYANLLTKFGMSLRVKNELKNAHEFVCKFLPQQS